MPADSLRSVPNFTVAHPQYGSVRFLGNIDVSEVDLDASIHFEPRSVDVYPDERVKPPVGEKLNRPALIVLKDCWPVNPQTRQRQATKDARLLQHYEDKLRQACAKQSSQFVKYDSVAGEWHFQVEHFTKYGLDDDEEMPSVAPAPISVSPAQPKPATTRYNQLDLMDSNS
eukprot:TRINITY_DN5851_c0_g1_i1.p1 TRINITY_DN5851_c0_g1~~TRINITY_DN5851_c0_g1_i1.p1  ORF type:complete len:201 (-),score=67.57 TRINITY_DN5851_c0_g1_i1:375-887(-)